MLSIMLKLQRKSHNYFKKNIKRFIQAYRPWDGLAAEFSTLMNGAGAEGHALATRVIHPNLTSLKLIETVRVKIPAFPLTQFTICMGEYAVIQRMMDIANLYPYVMVASDCKDLAKEMSATNIPYTAYLCRQLCEKYLQTKSLTQLASKYNLGTYQAEIDTAIAQFTQDHPVTTGKLENLFGQPSDDVLRITITNYHDYKKYKM